MKTPKSYATAGSIRNGKRRFIIGRQLLLIVLMYVYLYNPIFYALGFGSIKPLLVIAIMYAFVDQRVFKLLMQFKYEMIFSLVIITYAIFTVIRCDSDLSYVPYAHVIWFLECIFLPLVIVIWFRAEFAGSNWERWVIITGSIASIITIVLILAPEWNDYVRLSLITNFQRDTDYYLFRGFGIAENLISTYGMIQGIILGMCLSLLRWSALFAVPVLPLLISIAFNARTGFFVVLVSLIILIAQRRLRLRLAAIVVGGVLLVGYGLLSQSDFVEQNFSSIIWIAKLFSQTSDFISGSSSGESTYDYLLVDNVFFPPSTTGLLFGDGVFTLLGKSADNGYINQIMFGGIGYLLLLVGFLAYMYMRVSRQKGEGFYPAFFFLVLLIVNIKWNYLFVPNGIFRLVGFYYVLVITSRPRLPMVSYSQIKK